MSSSLKKAKSAKATRAKSPVRRQAPSRKAVDTRYRLLEGTMECLIQLGYAQTSISTIAERAGVSRGAMQFHFPTRASAIAAVIGHVLQRRMDTYRSDMARMPANADIIDYALRAYWRQIGQPEFVAQQELALAARTDPVLARHFRAAYRQYIQLSRQPFADAFPEWKNAGTKYRAAVNHARYLIEGMTWGRMYGHLDDKSVQDMLRTLRTTMIALLDIRDSKR